MVRELKVPDGSIRIWLDEFPAAIIPIGVPTESKFRAKQALPRFRKLACEMATLTGKFNYALLGCEVGELRESLNNVRIFETDYDGLMYGNSMLRASEKVRIGLPAEFIPGILEGLAFAEPLVSAFLDFGCGAYGEVSSNQIMFSAAANALMKVLERAPDQLDDDFLAGLISGAQISAITGFRS